MTETPEKESRDMTRNKKGEKQYYCIYCGRFSTTPEQIFEEDPIIIYPAWNNREPVKIFDHYDGCLGWD